MVPLSWRNMNPGNLRGEYFGATGSSGGFATYPDWTSGWNAMESQLDRYYAGKTTGKPLRSVREIINTWAPSSENDTDSYVKKVAKDLGVDPDVVLPWTPEVKKQLMTSMASHEAGRPTTYGATGENTMPPGILDPEALSIDVPDIGGLLASLGGGGPNVTPPMNQAQEHLWAQLAQIPGVGGQQTQPSSPGFGQRALTNPWLQMGLGILTADPSRGPLAAIAGGVQKGLLGVNAAEQQQIENQQREQQREQARMWQSLQAAQTMQDILKQAEKFRSDSMIKPQDLASVASANKNVVDARAKLQEMRYGKQGSPSSPYAVLNRDGSIAGTAVRNQWGSWIDPTTQAPFAFKPGQYFAQPPGGTVAGGAMGSAAPETAANRDRLKSQAKGFGDLDERLTTLIDMYDTQKNSFGTVGAVGEKFVGAGQTLDALGNQIFGTDSTMLGDAATGVFGDPTEVRTQLEQLRQPVARLMVDEKGPLATQEQQMARELIGSVTLEDALRSPQQVLTKLKSLRDLARKGRANIDSTLYGDGVTIGEVASKEDGPPEGSGITAEMWKKLSPEAKASIRGR